MVPKAVNRTLIVLLTLTIFTGFAAANTALSLEGDLNLTHENADIDVGEDESLAFNAGENPLLTLNDVGSEVNFHENVLGGLTTLASEDQEISFDDVENTIELGSEQEAILTVDHDSGQVSLNQNVIESVEGFENSGNVVGDQELNNDEHLNLRSVSLGEKLEDGNISEDLTLGEGSELSDGVNIDARAIELQSTPGLDATSSGLAVGDGGGISISSSSVNLDAEDLTDDGALEENVVGIEELVDLSSDSISLGVDELNLEAYHGLDVGLNGVTIDVNGSTLSLGEEGLAVETGEGLHEANSALEIDFGDFGELAEEDLVDIAGSALDASGDQLDVQDEEISLENLDVNSVEDQIVTLGTNGEAVEFSDTIDNEQINISSLAGEGLEENGVLGVNVGNALEIDADDGDSVAVSESAIGSDELVDLSSDSISLNQDELNLEAHEGIEVVTGEGVAVQLDTNSGLERGPDGISVSEVGFSMLDADQALDLGSQDLEDGTTTIWDATAEHLVGSLLEDNSVDSLQLADSSVGIAQLDSTADLVEEADNTIEVDFSRAEATDVGLGDVENTAVSQTDGRSLSYNETGEEFNYEPDVRNIDAAGGEVNGAEQVFLTADLTDDTVNMTVGDEFDGNQVTVTATVDQTSVELLASDGATVVHTFSNPEESITVTYSEDAGEWFTISEVNTQ